MQRDMLYKLWKENINFGLVTVDIATKLKIYITHTFLSDQQPRNLGQLFWAKALPGELRIIWQRACACCINDHKAQTENFAKICMGFCGHCTISEFI
jgi:hypothetical protein